MSVFRRKITDVSPTKAQEKKTWTARLWSQCKQVLRALLLLGALGLTAYLTKKSFPQISNPALAWFALAPFIWGVTKLKRAWTSVLYSFLTGLVTNALLFYWIYYTCVRGGGLSLPLAAAAWLGLSALMAVPWAIWGGSCFFLKRLGNLYPFFAAAGVVALEWLHLVIAHYAAGFPWLMWGYTQWNLPETIQLAGITGAWGVSFAVVFVGISIGYACTCTRLKRAVFQLLLALAVFLGVFGYGKWALLQASKDKSILRLPVALMQPGIDQYKKWSPDFEQEIMQTLADLSAQTQGHGRLLTIWPESVTPGPVLESPYLEAVQQMALQTGSAQVLGSNTLTEDGQYVSAYLISAGEPPARYDKIHLVPFGEYIPLEKPLRALFKDLAVLGELGSFAAGHAGQPLWSVAGVPFGVTICFESIFPGLWLEQNRGGAKFFVNITNDAWYFETDAPFQHLAMNALRAAEMGRPVLRAANTGISAVFDAQGRLVKELKLNRSGILMAEVALAAGDKINFYTQWGDFFAWLCAALYFTVLLSAMVFAYE